MSADEPAPGLTAVPAEKQNALQNAGYVLQWWLFAAMTLAGFAYLARREARGPRPASLLDDDDDEEDGQRGGPGDERPGQGDEQVRSDGDRDGEEQAHGAPR